MSDNTITCGYCRAQIQPRDPFHVHGHNECLCGAEPRHNQYFHDGPTADALTPPSLPEKRTLADYRPQHDDDCASNRCAVCEQFDHAYKGDTGMSGYCLSQVGIVTGKHRMRGGFRKGHCTCGLDALIASLRVERSQRRENEKDHGAELIHQPIPDVVETEPRLTCGHRSDQGVTEGIVCMREDGHYGDHGASGDGWGASWPQKLGSHVERSQRSEDDRDQGAEFIHQTIPDVEGTEPRLNREE